MAHAPDPRDAPEDPAGPDVPPVDSLRAAALGHGVDAPDGRAEAVARACAVLGIPEGAAPALFVHAASSARNRPVATAADALLTLAECAIAACLDAEAGLPPSPWIADVVARCDRALARGEA